MKPFFFNIQNTVGIMVIPDADAHMDGHPVLTYSYILYRSYPYGPDLQPANRDHLLSTSKLQHPDYLGTIVFDQPDKSFTYTCDGINELSGDEVEEVIEKISHYRENPNIWRV